MAKTLLPSHAVFRLHTPDDGLAVSMHDGTLSFEAAIPWRLCRYDDPDTGIAFPLDANAHGEVFFDRQWGPFLGLEQHDPEVVRRSLRYGISPMVQDRRFADGVPFLFALIRSAAWSDAQVLDVMGYAQPLLDLSSVRFQGCSLLDEALDQGRLLAADGLWARGVRFGEISLSQGRPLWDVLLCSVAHWAVAVAWKGCASPAAARRTCNELTRSTVNDIARRFSPMLLQWIDRALHSGVALDVVRDLTIAQPNDSKSKKSSTNPAHAPATKTLQTSPLGVVLFIAGGHAFAEGDRAKVAHTIAERLLRAGANAQCTLVIDGELPGVGGADYAKSHGLHEAAVLIERVALHATLQKVETDRSGSDGSGSNEDHAHDDTTNENAPVVARGRRRL